ncbi:MAG TPA: lipocalin family protein [Polyangiaceae bacterium]|nr:lipocalin family protein [Polyangiaceae bacterium]
MTVLRSLAAYLSVLITSMAVVACQDEPLDVAPVELSRMQGRWFEIAKLPRPSQAGCSGTTAEYHMKSTSELLVVNECHEGDLQGPIRRAAARAVATDPSVPAKLSLDFGFAYGDFWILEVGAEYEYAVIGHPTRNYLWIMSRAPRLPRETLDGVLQRAKARGFPTGILSYTEQAP